MNSARISVLGLSLSALFVATPVFATVSVNVPDHCTVVDSDGVSHTYGPNQYLGICALQAAIDAGSVSGVSFSNAFPSLGLFVTKVNGVTADPSSQYWALYQNGAYASLGLSQLPVAAHDTIDLQLHDFSDNFLGREFAFTVGSLVNNAPPSPPSGGGLTLHDPFDVTRAVMYLGTKEKDGSFGSPLLDDWVAIMTGTGKAGDIAADLSRSFSQHPPTLSSVTDYERHAMALEALGINPYTGTGTDYIVPIVKAFDGTQIGDPSLVNDDIFALFPLMHAGYTKEDDIIGTTTAFIISQQRADGSWAGSVDLTAAAIQALELTGGTGANGAIKKATQYLHSAQSGDGGFGLPGQGNSSATSWVMQAISALGQSAYDWSAGTYQTPEYYLSNKQETDGGVEPQSADAATRIWATAYAIPAAEHKPWDALLHNFSKPIAPAPVTAAATTTEGVSASTTEMSPSAPTAAVPDAASGPSAPDDTSPIATSTALQAAAAGATAGSPDATDLLWALGLVFILGFPLYKFSHVRT